MPPSLRPLPRVAPPRELYRFFLRNMRYVPDPHVWTQIVPPYKRLLRQLGRPLPPPPEGPPRLRAGSEKMEREDGRAGGSGEGSSPTSKDTLEKRWEVYAAARERKYREIQQAKTGLNQLRAAVACHPHAFERLLSQAYAQSGKVRWKVIKRITLSSPIPSQDWARKPHEPALTAVSVKLPDLPQPTPRPPAYPPLPLQPLPPVLRPLVVVTTEMSERGRLKPLPLVRLVNRDRERWLRDWDTCGVPITIPPNPHGTATGWEGRGLEETLRLFAGLANTDSGASLADPRSLPSYAFIPPGLARVFPKYTRYGSPPDAYPKPRAAVVQGNSRLWSDPRHFGGRLRRRLYARFLDKLPRVQLAKEVPNPAWREDAASSESSGSSASAYPEPKTVLTWKKSRITKAEVLARRLAAFGRASDDEMRWWRAHLDKDGSGIPELSEGEEWLVRKKPVREGRDTAPRPPRRVVEEETPAYTRTIQAWSATPDLVPVSTGGISQTQIDSSEITDKSSASPRKARVPPAETEKPKRRGRKAAGTNTDSEGAASIETAEKPKRGRARKSPAETKSAESTETTKTTPKRRGRPRKNPAPDE